MKKSLIATLVAAPVLSLSSMAFAAEPVSLTDTQMDVITAGFFDDYAVVVQYNASPVNVIQANVFTNKSKNEAYVTSGNFSYISQ